MNQSDIKKIVEDLIKTFLDAGKISLDLRKKLGNRTDTVNY